MGKEPYVSPEGYTPEVLEVFPYKTTGLACLVVQSNEDRDLHLSEINLCADFSAEDPETVFSLRGWIYSMLQKSDDAIFIAHSGKKLRYGPHDNPQIVLSVEIDVTRLCASSQGAFIIGIGGYVGHFDGTRLVDMPITQSEDIYFVSEAPDGTIFASGGKGGLFRRDGDSWSQIDLPIGSEIYHILALDRKSVLMAGSDGFCGRLDGDALTIFNTPDKRDYRAVVIYHDRVFLGTGFLGLEVLDGNDVVPFKENIISYHLFANDQYLFAAGLNEVARYDGKSWLATEFT